MHHVITFVSSQVLNELGDDFKARVRTSEFTSKLHLVDLAGSERVKRSGVTGVFLQGHYGLGGEAGAGVPKGEEGGSFSTHERGASARETTTGLQ